jgi:hypothetical protein
MSFAESDDSKQPCLSVALDESLRISLPGVK